VTIHAPYRFVFGQLIGLEERTLTVFSTAQYNSTLPISINLAGIYGQDNPRVTLAIRGHNSLYEHGDPYSSEEITNGQPNPLYKPDGYNLKVDLLDPEDWGNFDAPERVKITTTYTIYKPDSTPGDYSDDVAVASYKKAPNRDTNNKWVTPTGFTIDTNTYGTGIYRINVKSSAGDNGNGFSLRAGPPGTFNSGNGTKIMAEGPLCIRFNETGQIKMELGFVPASAAGKKLHVNKFDTDIGSTSIKYTCSTLPNSWNGVLAQNGEWREDVIDIPASYGGGVWYATYYAGTRDVSTWLMWYEGMDQESNGFVVLVE
jgi:hypothetical protein